MDQSIKYLLAMTQQEGEMLDEVIKHYHFKSKVDFFRYVIRSTYEKMNKIEYIGVMGNLKVQE